MYRLQCFGTLLVETLDGREIHFRSRKHLALLLYLAAHPKRAIGRGSLAALFWDTDEDAARHSLSQALYDLRKRLHPFQLHTRGGGLRLAEGQVRYEGAEFEEAIRSGDLTVATALYRGAFAPNLERVGAMDFERWYEAERDRFRTLAQMCLRKYVEQCDLQGQWGEMCLTALRLVKLDPLDEGAHRSLMRALWLHGDQQSALKHYAEVRSFLVKELPTGPSAETLELVKRIKSSRPRASRPLQPGDQRLPLVGRASEFEKLRTEVRQIRSKRGRILVLRGEAGIGKTRLLEEMAKIAPVEGIAHFRSRCYPAEANVAYGPILDGIQPIATRLVKSSILASHDYYQLGHLFPQLFVRPPEEEFEAIDPAVRQRRLYEEVTDLIRRMCAATPVLWVVEDVQWIDRSSASLLHYIARRLRERPFTLILSVRSEIALGEAAARLMGEAGAQVETHFLDLGPLDEASVRELIVLAAGDADEDARQLAEKYSGGNPFYALEILRAAQAGDGGGPRSQGLTRASLLISNRLRVLLTARLQGLPPQALRLLEAVAALDRHAAPQHVTKVAGLLRHEAEPLSMELCARGLLREAEDRFEFTHDIMREFVYKNLGLLRRAALHLAVGEILASASDAGPAILAHHFQLGADQARAYEFAMRGAEEAVSTCAHREAVSMATVAQSVAATPEHRFAALRLRAEAELAAGDFKAGSKSYAQLIDNPLASDPALVSCLRLSLARALLESSRWEAATAQLSRIDQGLSSVSDRKTRVEFTLSTLSLRLKLAMLSQNAATATEINKSITSLYASSRTQNNLTLTATTDALCSMTIYATFFESSTHATCLLREAERLVGHLSIPLKQKVLLFKALVSLRTAQWDQAALALDQGLRLARRVNDVATTAHLTNNLACLSLEQGQWNEAITLCRRCIELDETISGGGHLAVAPLVNMANAYFYQGKARRARQLYDQALEVAAASGYSPLLLEVHACLGLVALQEGDQLKAEDHARELSACLDETNGVHERFKIEWLRAYMDYGLGTRAASDLLRQAAEEERSRDIVGALKLAWLERLLYANVESGWPGDTRSVAVAAEMRSIGLGWFSGFTRRWLKTARSRSTSTCSE